MDAGEPSPEPHARSGLDMHQLAVLLEQRGRRALFLELKIRHGLSLEHASSLVASVTKSIEEGELSVDGCSLDPKFESAARMMPPDVRALLVDNAEPRGLTSPESLLSSLGYNSPQLTSAALNGFVMRAQSVLSARACALLRAAVDSDRRLESDSVDQAPEHQLNLSRTALEALIGAEEANRLWRLPRSYRRQATVVAVPPPPEAVGSGGSAQQLLAQSAAL